MSDIADREHSLIAVMMQDPSIVTQINGSVVETDFVQADTRKMFNAIHTLAEVGKPHDPVSVAEYLNDWEPVKASMAVGYTSSNAQHYATAIRGEAKRRQLTELLQNSIAKLSSTEELPAITAELVNKIDRIAEDTYAKDISFREVLKKGYETIERAFESREANGICGVPTGLKELDDIMGGMQPQRLVIVAARPSIGKTALANQIALHAASLGHPVGMCSLEMGLDEIAIRSFAHAHKANVSHLAMGSESAIGTISRGEQQKPIHGYPYWIDDSTYGLGGIQARITDWHRKHGIKVAIVDHIGLVDVSGAYNANDRTGKVSRALKILAKRLKITIIAVSQLNRNVEREKRRPVLADLRDSGNVEQDCDIAMFLHSDPESEGSGEMRMEMGLLKHRGGRKGWLPGNLVFKGVTQTFAYADDDF